MTHYPYCFTIHRLQLAAKLGWYDAERRRPQPVELTIRLFFPKRPECVDDDFAHFIDYDVLCNSIHSLVGQNEYRLIEYMAQAMLTHVRAFIDDKAAHEVKIWLNLTKCAPAVPHLLGGASFAISDLAHDATTIAPH